MGSNLKQTRILQKEALLRRLAQKKAKLIEQGSDSKSLKKNTGIQHLLADIKRASRAIASIETREQVINTAKQQKQEKAQQAAAEKTEPKKKKKAKEKTVPAKKEKTEKKQKKQKQGKE